MNTCGPATQPKKLLITLVFEAPVWAFLILLLSFSYLLFHVYLLVFLKALLHFCKSLKDTLFSVA
jgi:fatty acid desaturase